MAATECHMEVSRTVTHLRHAKGNARTPPISYPERIGDWNGLPLQSPACLPGEAVTHGSRIRESDALLWVSPSPPPRGPARDS